MEALLRFAMLPLRCVLAFFRNRTEQAIVELALCQQLREAFPSDRIPRHLLRDRDSIFSVDVLAAIRSFGVDPVRTAYRSPLQHLIAERVYTRLGDSPEGRSIETRASPAARVVALPRVGGLYHRYVWAEAA